jgi:hypothetical protein
MMPYNVILTDPLGLIGDHAVYRSIERQLENWFNRVIASSPALLKEFPSARVRWLYGGDYDLSLLPHELLIYFTTPELSVASALGPRSYDPYVTKNWGYSTSGTARGASSRQSASEVYVYTKQHYALSALAFHEAMHNKLSVGDKALHEDKHTAGANGLAMRVVDDNSDLTKENETAMAAHLRDPRPQYTAGIRRLADRRRRRDQGDPAWDK